MGRAPVAAVLALLLAAGAGILPAAVPGVVLPAVIGPAVALAADDIDITTAARYTVQPDDGRVRVVVDVTAVNGKPNSTSGGTVTRFFYDGVNLGLQPEARNVRATQDGEPVRVDLTKRKGYSLITVYFREDIYVGESAEVRLTFDLPGGAPRSGSDVRVGSAFATFMAWAFGDRGNVRVEVPSDFRVEISGEDMPEAPGRDGLQVYASTTGDPLEWYAWVNATNDAALTRDRLVLGGGEEVVIRGWPEDERWRDQVRTLLRESVPELVRFIGLDWPVDGALTVSEVHTPLLEGYAGFYNPSTDEITISEDLDELTIVHEASHAWFNSGLFRERWITEGLADEYAARVLRRLDTGYPGPDRVRRSSDAAFPLNDWPPPAPIDDEESDARETYGYDASWTVMRRIVNAVGIDGMRDLFAAADAGTTAYPGEVEPEPTRLPNDWRRFLDLAQAEGAGIEVEQLIETWALGDEAAELLPLRAAARDAYAGLERAGGAWAAPAVVRLALDGWDFNGATATIEDATQVLGTRDEIAALAAEEGLEPPDRPEEDYEEAGSSGELALVGERAEESLAVLVELAEASDTVAAPRDWLTDLGLDGTDPAEGVAAARDAWEAGDLATARTASAVALASLAAAPEGGRNRAIVVGGVVTLVLSLLLFLVVFIGWRVRPAGRRDRAMAVSSAVVHDAAASPGGAWPYATLPPDGPPVGPAGGLPPGGEGADRS